MISNSTPSVEVSQSVHELVVAKIETCIRMANKRYDKSFGFPTINYSIKNRTAGLAYGRRWEIKFNPILLKENLNEFINRTVPHEFAHLVVWDVYDTIGHGPRWKHVMCVFGEPNPTRYHSYDTSNCTVRQIRRRNECHSRYQYKYRCDCRVLYISSIKHNRIQRGITTYRCKGCKAELVEV
ncbi:MAG: SprT-like domain-containing protein [Nitrosopumilaceae archaeon]